MMPYKEAQDQVTKIMVSIDKNHSNSIDYTGII